MNETKTNWSVPVAIIIAGVLIAGAIYLKGGTAGPGASVANAGNLDKLEKVSKEDRIRGELNAPIKLVEYSDLECPFCKAFHRSMEQIFTKQNAAKAGSLAWIYRHFPLDSLHPKARKEAEAVECAREQAGNDGFWKFTDKIFSVTPSNNGLDVTLLPTFAKELKLDEAKFNTCLAGSKTAKIIEEDYQNGLKIGVDGTPAVIIVMENGKAFMPLKEPVPTEASAEVKALVTDIFTTYQAEIEKLGQG